MRGNPPEKRDLVILGGGPAGMAAAVAAWDAGIHDLLILEREEALGGILNQCIHNGFGLHRFGEELTGPEYAARYIDQVLERGIPYLTATTVVHVMNCRHEDHETEAANPHGGAETDEGRLITAVSAQGGLMQIRARSVILAMGCRERPRGALKIPGFNPAGIFSAGTAQKLVNLEGYLPGKQVVILGSGDIGLIMARRMTLEGAKVKLVAELQSFSGGLKRNIVQCLQDYGIPLKLNHTVVRVHGKKRVQGITLAAVDPKTLRPIAGTETYYACDTLLLSVGLLPENEISREMGVRLNPLTGGAAVNESLQTSETGVFSCGNVLHVHDLVDDVSEEAALAGLHAAEYLQGTGGWQGETGGIVLTTGGAVRYTVPERIHPETVKEKLSIRFRVTKQILDGRIYVYSGETLLLQRNRQVMTPGEMEQVTLTAEQLAGAKGEICMTTEERGC